MNIASCFAQMPGPNIHESFPLFSKLPENNRSKSDVERHWKIVWEADRDLAVDRATSLQA